jgi:hypothetical protein
MAFKDDILTFKEDQILSEDNMQVMMSWEAPIMEKSAEFICHNKGDILELGFGMGICSDYIQAQNVNSHTIVEIHPQIIEKLKGWASGKSNVIIVEGDWHVASELNTYDGIFLDTFRDENAHNHFKSFALNKAKPGAKITYWNNDNEGDLNQFKFDSISFEVVPITVPENDYAMFLENYHMPKIEL